MALAWALFRGAMRYLGSLHLAGGLPEDGAFNAYRPARPRLAPPPGQTMPTLLRFLKGISVRLAFRGKWVPCFRLNELALAFRECLKGRISAGQRQIRD